MPSARPGRYWVSWRQRDNPSTAQQRDGADLPEGSRSHDGAMIPFMKGYGLFASRPVSVIVRPRCRAFQAYPRQKKFPSILGKGFVSSTFSRLQPSTTKIFRKKNCTTWSSRAYARSLSGSMPGSSNSPFSLSGCRGEFLVRSALQPPGERKSPRSDRRATARYEEVPRGFSPSISAFSANRPS